MQFGGKGLAGGHISAAWVLWGVCIAWRVLAEVFSKQTQSVTQSVEQHKWVQGDAEIASKAVTGLSRPSHACFHSLTPTVDLLRAWGLSELHFRASPSLFPVTARVQHLPGIRFRSDRGTQTKGVAILNVHWLFSQQKEENDRPYLCLAGSILLHCHLWFLFSFSTFSVSPAESVPPSLPFTYMITRFNWPDGNNWILLGSEGWLMSFS